ncbi:MULTISPECIES: DUF5642 family protein [unclassified Mycolicibacterium]|uniref:DUF5642 family protein n=1 Tax=unclassified Mycolicibacterium TaxID=2636767 RepID=UPI0012DC3D33|nr:MULTISPECIES: DUF5642 family protein [unclassified Mycolicibacterium]MUL85301.1 hypothetical protein [Mycolicibacterium sp. CBMA 329]MUL91268.1 hypothetical protein [Mycolicibacterium sp. CBMA 331]MUM02532.1 hypothetical protein [Mycolicibacterium sp. CBMA 334]MUM29296.1 hypothetical protein [Mycolicibacterium sp. CBMA 295]MUM41027.1 hypothetical protein [Mycolicibacterium sp. CBMA 247]
MSNRTVFLATAGVLACTTGLVACGQSDQSESANADIANVAKVRSSFGPEFKVTDVAPTGIDPKMLAPQKMPPGVKVEPTDCAKFAEGQSLPEGLKGNMAATSAEGAGNRFIVLAVETSESIPLNDPGDACKQVKFLGPGLRGQVDVVEAPQIDGARTVGTHRIVQTVMSGQARTGELYNYVASFDTFMVIVTANPLVVPGKPVSPVDEKRARDLLGAAVAAVRG